MVLELASVQVLEEVPARALTAVKPTHPGDGKVALLTLDEDQGDGRKVDEMDDVEPVMSTSGESRAVVAIDDVDVLSNTYGKAWTTRL